MRKGKRDRGKGREIEEREMGDGGGQRGGCHHQLHPRRPAPAAAQACTGQRKGKWDMRKGKRDRGKGREIEEREER